MAEQEATQTFARLGAPELSEATAVCIGTGRFLRAVLVPTLVELGEGVILAQTRGTSFCQHMKSRPDSTYEVDTVLQDGQVLTQRFPIVACGSLGVKAGREAFLQLPSQLKCLRYVGLGLTEAGIVHNGQSIIDLAEFLHSCFTSGQHTGKISVINTDNMPFNGDAVGKHVRSCDFTQNVSKSEAFLGWLQEHVCFHNSMVDRITSHRKGDTDVPRAEPLPAKSLVLEDLDGILPQQVGSVPGVVVRSKKKELELDIALKLRIANGLHTAMVYAMSLGRIYQTDGCIGHPDILPYLEQLFEDDIVHSCAELSMPRLKATPVMSEWMARLQHPHFGLSCFFVCQNAVQKLGIRLLPSVRATLLAGEAPSPFMAFAFAVALRFLTPVGTQARIGEQPPVFVGRLDDAVNGDDADDWDYVPGLKVRPEDGTYEFKDGDGIVPLILRPLGTASGCSLAAALSLAGEVLARLDGFDPRSVPEHKAFAGEVGRLLHRMLSGEKAMQVLASLRPQQPVPLQERQVAEAVKEEVEAAEAIDVHTHLFSDAFGPPLMLYGIDALLTYHYLTSEYLATSVETAEEFFQLPQSQQADRVWDGLFVRSSPISEHCRGVLSTLNALGLREEVASRDLAAIRRWYAGQDPQMFNEKAMRLARLRYVITSHNPFDPVELSGCLEPPPQPPRYRRALLVDALLEGDWSAVRAALAAAGEKESLRGVAALLRRCAAGLKPVYVTASTAENFQYEQAAAPSAERLDAPLCADVSPQDVLNGVILPLCAELGVPLSLRLGRRRGVFPPLGLGGDGVGPAPLGAVATLCRLNQKVKFLATVLNRGDQHELAVLSGKFRNLHLWGCWWYCNNPSVVSELTALRLELLGTGFTFQASSARVHDQLISKWIHARAQLSKALEVKYVDLMATGWSVSRRDIRRDVQRLLGGAFEEFLTKSL
eukprot:TRINITY_DN26643_c0_g4_i1.p1 TRINITY_DN26643_c0_g4~~TRINITY_DN26643_c0_g4_i1.p1  ORF type:complete len:937 (+),score=189.83 TRINITY_DN26643_c0_g4_i1:92-2902(+)